MKQFALIKNDFTSTFRDPIFKGLLFVPLINVIVVVFALPSLVAKYPALLNYIDLIIMWSCMQTASMFGFIYGFLFLEEKEENVFEALRIIPISGQTLSWTRLAMAIGISFSINLLILGLNDYVHLVPLKMVLVAFLFSLLAPSISMILAVFAHNRVEGTAQLKIINIVFYLPGMIYFFTSPWAHLTAVIPVYWSFRALETAANAEFWMYWSIGLLFHTGLLTWLNHKLMHLKT